MLIIFDIVLDADGHPLITHQIETAAPGVLDMFERLKKGEQDMAVSGWGEPAHHPDHPGKTRYEVALAEMKRLGDLAAIKRLHL
jgi:hypothetical protein